MAQLEEEKREHDNKMKKMETEMEQVFEMKVREKRQKLKDSEADVSEKRATYTIFYSLELYSYYVIYHHLINLTFKQIVSYSCFASTQIILNRHGILSYF